MPDLTPVVTRDAIESSITAVAQQISSDYRGSRLVLIGVLKGAFVFLADLIRKLTIPVEIDFLRVASYGAQTTSSGTVQLTKDLEIDIAGKDVLVVEDIVDSGLTLAAMIEHLYAKSPQSVRVCTLIDKRERRQRPVTIDYACHVIDHGFLVGYGLDCNERFRELPEIYHLHLPSEEGLS